MKSFIVVADMDECQKYIFWVISAFRDGESGCGVFDSML